MSTSSEALHNQHEAITVTVRGYVAAIVASASATNPYGGQAASDVPTEARQTWLGSRNLPALARLRPGEVVLDLGSGGGLDVLLSAKRVGPTGFAYGLDMANEMLTLAEENRQKVGVANVQFLKGYIEAIPLPENTVDVIIANCVINLAVDKRPVLQEAFRVLKPGGRFAVSDVVRLGVSHETILPRMEAGSECSSGALPVDVYTALLAEAGFTDIGIEVTRSDGVRGVTGAGGNTPTGLTGEEQPMADDLFISAVIRATKPRV